jgi:5-methyltetrahydropteroyltriglutamate--homocysteine methyltransferase
MIHARERGEPFDAQRFQDRLHTAVAEVVRQQIEAGLDIVSDGEFSKPSFATYVKNRLYGFTGQNPDRRIFADRAAFPEWHAQTPPPSYTMTTRPFCTEPLGWKDQSAVDRDIANLKAALANTPAEEAFLPAASLGIIAEIMLNQYYPTEEKYLFALAEVMKEEYQAIAKAGFLLQIDAPDAAMGRHAQFWNRSLDEFRQALSLRIEALNYALSDIPEEQIRYHICWGNYEGPHTHDVPLKDIVDLMLRVRAGAYSVEAANPRHAHEWQVWETVTLPTGKILIPGVIDSTTNFVEHPELVAQRIVQYATLVGRENVIAGTDCGFGTSAGTPRVHPTVMWAKFKALAEGAKLASQRLWSR